MSDACRYTAHYVSEAYHYVAHHAARAWHAVKRAYHAAAHFVRTAYHKVAAAARRVVHAVAAAARTAYHATTQAVAAAAKYAKAHAAAITSFVVSTAVFMGCEAVTTGVGTIGCAALSGAAGSLVTQGFKCADSGGDACSLGAFGEAGLEGGIEGAAGGILGEFGGGLLASAGGKALDVVGGLFGRGVEDAAGAGGEELGSAEARSATSSADGGGGAGSGGGEPDTSEAGTESTGTRGCHSFTGGTRVLMADGTSKPISQVKAGDKIADAVPGQKGTQAHKVSKVIVTRTDHDFVDVTVALVKAGTAAGVTKTARRAGSVLGSAAKGLKSKAKAAKAAAVAAVAVGVVAAGGQPALAATGTPAHAAAVHAPATTPAASTESAHGGTITTTFHHPFYDETQAAFTEAKDLHAGDVLQTPTGTAKVTAVRLFHASTVTYDLTIGTLHTYYVVAGSTPVLVHNCGNGEDADLFDTFNVKPGENLNLTGPSAANGRSYITYVAKDADGNVRYVGRAQGNGNPLQVMRGRIARGHDIFKQNPDLTPHVVDVQQSLEANKGAEEFFMQGYLQRGADLLNSPSSPPLGFSKTARGQKSVRMMDAFFDELIQR